MDDPDITMEEYVQLKTERALRNGKVYNWETTTYGKIWYDEDVHYLRFFEIEFPAIVYNDALASKSDLSSEPTECMTRSSTKDLLTPIEEPKRSKEEVTEGMGEPTMEEYMMKTREDYGSGIARPKFDDKAHFELKGPFLKELCDKTFSGSDNEAANEHIKKLQIDGSASKNYYEDVLKGLDVPTKQILDSMGAIPSMKAVDAKKAVQDMVDHSQKWHNGTSTMARITNTSDGLAAIQAQLNNLGREIKKVNERVYAPQVGCESCGGPRYTKDCPLKEEAKTLEEAYYTQFGVPFPQGGRYRAVALGFYQKDSGNPSYQERRQTMEESLSKFMAESAKRHDENSNLIKEIRATTDAATRNQGASIKALEIQIGQMSKVLQERGSGKWDKQIKASINVHDSAILEDALPLKEKDPGRLGELTPTKLIIELADRTTKRPKGIVENVSVGRPFLSTACAKIDVFKRNITLRVGDDKIVFKNNNPTNSIIRRVYALGLRERMEFDLEARLMVEALILDRSLDPTYGDYIELNDLNEPLEIKRNQVEDLGPTIKDGEVINKPMIEVTKTRNGDEEIDGFNGYLSFCDFDRKIRIDCAYNL
ncbi:hypothetical protein Tco_0791539 [Tanacetum coccineum]